MRKNYVILGLFFSIVTTCYAKQFNFQLKNKTAVELQIFYQVIQVTEKENPEFIFNIPANSQKLTSLKLKHGQKIKIIGYGGGVETLPIVRPFENLIGDPVVMELVLPKVEKINVVDLNDAISKLKNDNYLRILLDSSRYTADELPVLGTFVFYNLKNKKTLQLAPTYWKNTNEIRAINKQYFETIDYVNSSNSAGLNASGVPFLQKLGASFANTNLLEIVWRINNAHIEQWQPTTMNVFDIIQNTSSKPFIDACVNEMNRNSLGGGEYSLYFISSALVVDDIVVSAKKYNSIVIDAEVEVQPTGPNTEIVKPSVEAKYGYSREKLYSNIDSSATVYLKFLAQDYTPLLNAYISTAAKNAQKSTAIANLSHLEASLIAQYNTLRTIDRSFIEARGLETILPILDVTKEWEAKPEQFDSTGANITSPDILAYNKNVAQFNSILKSARELISQYKSTVESIEKLSQPTDYYKIVNSIEGVDLDKKIIDAIVRDSRTN